MGAEQNREIPFDEVVTDWYDEVYLPIEHIIHERGILRDFPDRTTTDLYLWISEHRAELDAIRSSRWHLFATAEQASFLLLPSFRHCQIFYR